MTAQAISWPEDRMTRREAAAYLGVSRATLDTWSSTGRYDLPFVRIGRLCFYRRSDLDRFIEERTVGRCNEHKAAR